MSRITESQIAVEEATWAAAKRLGSFSTYQLASEMVMSTRRAVALIKRWERAGAIEMIGLGQGGKYLYAAKPGCAFPRPTVRDGAPGPDATAPGNMWRAMRGLTSFTATDIAAHSTTPDVDVPHEVAQDYCQMLVRSGHIRVATKPIPGRREAIYRLVRNTGPLPPRERRVRAVWDDNLQEYLYIAGVTV